MLTSLCSLYNAISDQLDVRLGKKLSYQTLREQTAHYMREHRDDFLPFMETDDGGFMTEGKSYQL